MFSDKADVNVFPKIPCRIRNEPYYKRQFFVGAKLLLRSICVKHVIQKQNFINEKKLLKTLVSIIDKSEFPLKVDDVF